MNRVHPIFQPLIDVIAPPREVPSEDATQEEDADEERGESPTVGGFPRLHIGKREDDDE